MSKPIPTVKIIQKDKDSSFIQNKKINDLKTAMRELEDARKNEKDKDHTVKEASSKIFGSLKRIINTIMVIGPVGEAFSLASSVITGKFFKHYDTYFQNRIKDAIKSQDVMELQETKREARELRTSLLRVKAKVKNPHHKHLIQEKIDNLDNKIREAEKQINAV